MHKSYLFKKLKEYINESKQDEQKLIDFAGNSLAKRFLSIKNKLKSPENDIYYWLKKDIVELEDRINEVESTVSKTKQKEIEKTEGAELVVEENGWKVYRIDTYKASCLYGKGTKWCVASKETSSHFNDYKKEGIKLYYFIKNNEKYALALYPEIMDDSDIYGIKYNYELYDVTDKLITDFNQIKSLNLPEIPGVKLTFEILPTKIENGVLVKVYPYNQGEFVIPSSVTSIDNNAFFGCSSLTSITIPNSVTSIGDHAFYDCSSLTSITIPNSVNEISDGVFSHCESLTSITIPNSVTSIGNYAFAYCTSLKSITIPNSVTEIGDSAFYDCTSLTSITIPNSVTSIGRHAFYDCPSLTIYAEAPSEPDGWNADWNSGNRPVIWNYKNSTKNNENKPNEDKKHLISGELGFVEESIVEKLDVHKTLNPKIWGENNELLVDVENKIYQIVEEFKLQIEEAGVKLAVKDVYLLGSNANYNYNDDSDLDIHIMADESFDCKENHLPIIYNAYKSLFNSKYDITINGLEVELYVENIADITNISTGVYSLKKGWIKEPSQLAIPKIDEAALEKVVADWEKKYLEIMNSPSIDKIDKYIDDLYELRTQSMKKDGEFAFDNLVFKEIRRLHYFDNLKIMRLELKNEELSLK